MTIIGYYILNRFKKYEIAKLYLVAMSFLFYGYFNFYYIFIMLSSILVNFFLGTGMVDSTNRSYSKALLVIGIVFNLGLLFYYKYFNFFIDNINIVFGSNLLFEKILLPLGISFFTFQQLSYVIDSYRKTVPKYKLLDYSLFVTFFPQLVAGPIVLHSEVVPQFADTQKKHFNYDNFAKGLYAFSLGLAKKVLIADTFALFANWGHDNISVLSSTDAIFVMIAYTFQIYFDFSGYCDIATGIGYMFNIQLPMNFNSPYKSSTIIEFWERWHITLTRFFTKYVYIPLGGNRVGKIKLYRNIFIVFLVSGIWHGASWTFILWGILHGFFSIFTRILLSSVEKIPKAINWIITFIFVNLTWVLFRAETLTTAGEFYKKIFSFDFKSINTDLINAGDGATEFASLNLSAIPMSGIFVFLLLFIITFLCVVTMKNTNEKLNLFKPTYFKMLKTVLFLVWSVSSFAGISSFIYFNF